jgi:hypothetical protein
LLFYAFIKTNTLINPVLLVFAEPVRPLVWAVLPGSWVVRPGNSIFRYRFVQSPLTAPEPVKKPAGPGKKE